MSKKRTSKKKDSQKCCPVAVSSKFCSVHSSVAMKFMLKNGKNHLKLKNPNGGFSNPVVYNFVKINKWGIPRIVHKMKEKFAASFPELTAASNLIIFFDNATNTEIERVKV